MHPHIPAQSEDQAIFTVSPAEQAAVVSVACSRIHQHQAEHLRNRLIGVADRAGGRLAVCLEEVVDASSACINALLAVNTHCASMGGKLVLFGLNDEISKMLRMTKVNRTIAVATDAREALDSMDEPDPPHGLAGLFRRPRKRAA